MKVVEIIIGIIVLFSACHVLYWLAGFLSSSEDDDYWEEVELLSGHGSGYPDDDDEEDDEEDDDEGYENHLFYRL